MVQMVKNLLAMKEAQVSSLSGEKSLEMGMTTHSSILAWRIPDRGVWRATVHGVRRSMGSQRQTERLTLFHFGRRRLLYYILWEVPVCLVAQLCPTLCSPLDCTLSGSSVHEIVQVRILKWATISFSRSSSSPRDQTWVSCIAGGFSTCWAIREILEKY